MGMHRGSCFCGPERSVAIEHYSCATRGNLLSIGAGRRRPWHPRGWGLSASALRRGHHGREPWPGVEITGHRRACELPEAGNTIEDAAKVLGRDEDQVRQKAYDLGIIDQSGAP
jgi:hypothetical protein